MDTVYITTIFETGATNNPLDEILVLAQEVNSDIDCDFLSKTHQYIEQAFAGNDPQFKASNTEYHNIKHTYSVVLATVRLFHGLTFHGQNFSCNVVEQGLISSYFHDIGLLLKSDDKTEFGASYIRDHEKRSIEFMDSYLKKHGFSTQYRDNCACMIESTNLNNSLHKISFPSKEIKQAAWVVASADILGQMADRYYLEQLPLLYRERTIGGVNKHHSVAELMQQTAEFYNREIIYRLETSFHNVAAAMHAHFKSRWDIDRDLYKENIQKNIDYLSKILDSCQLELECIKGYLRRKQPPV